MKEKSDMTLGQIVDELADRYFASGMDGFSANVTALSEVLGFLTFASDCMSEIVEVFHGDSEVQPDV